ncbi:hypothetical protein [Cellulomonas aerilata]|uniref:Uncharacterized protein n=1 Tax=Cellulomonas aerilata TaxID=515326 RepID=A0A512D7E3_9CELL|nr:hypothetical protein [Cellulomonas aerilata]GEO32404.1 hypothetical protein CAE01nite_01290 [Cellulomonas aerilata]
MRWLLLRLRRRPPPPDPFEVLRVQMRLAVLADEVRALERSDDVYARMHHLRATEAAYDAMLIRACHLAGVPTSHGPDERTTVPQSQEERFRAEVELAARGWSW